MMAQIERLSLRRRQERLERKMADFESAIIRYVRSLELRLFELQLTVEAQGEAMAAMHRFRLKPPKARKYRERVDQKHRELAAAGAMGAWLHCGFVQVSEINHLAREAAEGMLPPLEEQEAA